MNRIFTLPGFVALLSLLMLLYPTITVVAAFLSGTILISVPLLVLFFSGIIGLRIASALANEKQVR